MRQKPKTAAEMLLRLKGTGSRELTWAALAEKMPRRPDGKPFNRGYLKQVASGQRRASNTLLWALKLPLNSVPVQPCQGCGEVHDFLKICPSKRLKAKLARAKRGEAMYHIKNGQTVTMPGHITACRTIVNGNIEADYDRQRGTTARVIKAVRNPRQHVKVLIEFDSPNFGLGLFEARLFPELADTQEGQGVSVTS